MLDAKRHQFVLLAGIFALILCMGIGRYAFTPMIPILQDQVGITAGTAGWLAGWGYMGYLVGLFVVWLISDLKAKDFFFRYGLIVSVIATALMAAHDHVMVWAVSRFFAGVASAAGFMLGTGLIINWLLHHNKQLRIGVHFAGMGLGIMLSAVIVHYLSQSVDMNWRFYWLYLAATAACLLVPVLFFLPMPKQDEIEMSRTGQIDKDLLLPSEKWIWLMHGAYFCAGFSNTTNVTFTSLIAEMGDSEGFGTMIWLIVGLAATPAPLIWERIATKISYFDALVIAFMISIMSNIVLLISSSTVAAIIAALLFGFSFIGIVSLTLTTVGRRFRSKSSQIMARLTLGYCIAQIVSPIISGVVADWTGSFTVPIILVILIMLGGCFLLYQARKEDHIRYDKPFMAPSPEDSNID